MCESGVGKEDRPTGGGGGIDGWPTWSSPSADKPGVITPDVTTDVVITGDIHSGPRSEGERLTT